MFEPHFFFSRCIGFLGCITENASLLATLNCLLQSIFKVRHFETFEQSALRNPGDEFLSNLPNPGHLRRPAPPSFAAVQSDAAPHADQFEADVQLRSACKVFRRIEHFSAQPLFPLLRSSNHEQDPQLDPGQCEFPRGLTRLCRQWLARSRSASPLQHLRTVWSW